MEIKEVSVVGAGKVGTAFACALAKRGYTIGSVISSSVKGAEKLASRFGAVVSDRYDIPATSGLVIIAVPDSRIVKVAGDITAADDTLVLHTAGSFGLEVFPAGRNYRCGVLYPLQTFSEGRTVDLDQVPLLVEGDSPGTEKDILGLAKTLSEKTSVIDTGKRRSIHLAAVYACNFVNYMLGVAEEISGRSEIEFSLFEPLVKETINKAFELGPSNSQTGPAVRNDTITIKKQTDLLSYSPQLKELYEMVTGLIIEKEREKADE